MKFYYRSITILLFLVCIFTFFSRNANADTSLQEQIVEKQRQIEELQKQIDDYQGKATATATEAKTLANEVSKLNYQINQHELEIQSIELSIKKASIEIDQTKNGITDAGNRLELQKNGIASFLRLMNETDKESTVELLLKNDSLSDFFANLDSIKSSQKAAKAVIENMRQLKEELVGQQGQLESFQQEQQGLRQIEVLQRQSLANIKGTKDSLLKETRGREQGFRELISRSQSNINNLKQQIQFLLAQGLSLDDVLKFGELAANQVGIRPEFLLAILEVESGLGRNVGSGNWEEDMVNCYLRIGRPDRAAAEKKAFLQITSELGVDPNSVKVSAEPYYGCGGAMGPAQFLPTTWLGYRDKVAAIVGHAPNPWNIQDAFYASGIKLAAGGATSKTRAGETAAAKAYISGSSSCTKTICGHYASLVLSKAEQLKQEL